MMSSFHAEIESLIGILMIGGRQPLCTETCTVAAHLIADQC